MTATTERDQIFFRVVAGLTSHFSVVDLEAFHRTTALAAPSVPGENPSA